MKNARDDWSNHVAAIKAQCVTVTVTASAYAKQYKLQSQSAPHAVAVAVPKPQSQFVALRVRDAVLEVASPSCRRNLKAR